MKRVSVVIATYRRPLLLRRCLRALARQSLPGDSFEVIVADDDANPRLEAWLGFLAKRLPYALRYVPVRHTQGPAGARNAGAAKANAPLLAFTDDDTLPHETWLSHGLRHWRLDVIAAWGRVKVPLRATPTDHELMVQGLETAGFVTANAFCLREAFSRIGGFDTSFTRAWREDSDLYFRLLDEAERTGARVIHLPTAVVDHPPRPVRWGISLSQQANNYFNALLFKKHPRHYRRFIQRRPPLRYYAAVAAAGGLVAGLVQQSPWVVMTCVSLWLFLTIRFAHERLKRTRKDFGHLWEMAVTSALIPPFAIFWRLRGALRWRVLFL